MKRILARLTYANVVASMALFIALAGGTAFAASQFEKESIPGRALKKETIGPNKLNAAAKATLVGPAGPKGAPGAPGVPGTPGAAGATKVDVVYGNEADGSFAHCPAGQVAVGGGGEAFTTELFVSEPLTGIALTPPGGGTEAIAYAICASP
jgi:hypothetical protein